MGIDFLAADMYLCFGFFPPPHAESFSGLLRIYSDPNCNVPWCWDRVVTSDLDRPF